MTESRSRRWLKLGCLGVIAVVVLSAAWVGAIFGTAYLRGQRELVVKQELSRELPDRPQQPAGEVAAAGRVVLDLTVGEFFVRPGAPGDPIRVDAKFDERSYRLTESWEEAADGIWIYRLLFEETSWFKDGGLRALLGGSFPRIEIRLPPDVPLALEGHFGKGGSELDLGGLWLTEVDLNAEKGGFNLYFAEPLAVPLERLAVHAKQGGASLRRIGNASPRRLEVVHRMGGLSVDLQGQWVCDSEIRIVSSMGGAGVVLPRDVSIEGLEDRDLRLSPPSDPEIPLPRLHMSISESFGEVKVIKPR